MNVRKLLDWRKLLIYSHRWMGITFGLLFVSWFISGIAFMYWGMPTLTPQERQAHQKPVDLSSASVTPLDAANRNDVQPASLRIQMKGDRPVYMIGRTGIYADTGELVPVTGADREQALDIIRTWVPEHAATVRYDKYLEDSDQWTLQSAQRNQMPLHRVALDDDAATFYYVSEGSGEIAMKTDRVSRFKGFLSGVLHWVYFPPLRKHGNAWTQFIIWGSIVGGVMCLTGLVAGIWRLSPSRRFRQKRQASHTPYSGMMRWHHYSGLLFGVVSFTWIISGAISVNPWGMFSAGRGAGLSQQDRAVLTGGRLKLDDVSVESLRAGLDAIRTHFEPKEIEVQQFRGKPYMTATRPLGDAGPRVDRGQRGAPIGEYQMVWLADPGKGTFTRFDNSDIEQIADTVMAGVPVQDRVWLTEYDNYYRSRENIRPLPVLRIRYLDEQSTWLYFDPHRGAITPHQRITRINRWLYAGLHEFDFPFLYNSRPLWDIVVIVLSIGGILLSSTTLWPMVKRLARHGRRVATVFRPVRARAPAPVSAQARATVGDAKVGLP
jgi:hypothetical protein